MALSIVDFKTIDFAATGTPRSTASMTWNAGDLFVIVGGAENFDTTITTPTFGGGTFTAIGSSAVSGHCEGRSWQCTPAGSGSGTISSTVTATLNHWGLAVWQFRGHNGIGVNNATVGTPFVASLTVSAQSAVVGGWFDWTAAAAGRTGTPTISTERLDAAVGSNYTIWLGDWLAQAAGTRNYGTTAGAANNVVVLVEVKEAAAVASQPSKPMQMPQLVAQ